MPGLRYAARIGPTSGGRGDFPDSDSRFRELALSALDKQQTERGRLARLLHDEVAQMLSAAGLQLDILRMDLEDKVPGIASRTSGIQDLLERVVKRIRELSYELNPEIVGRAGLRPALDLLVGRFRKLFSGTLRLVYDSWVRVPPRAGIALEKIAEEAVTNAIRHSGCSQIEIVVKRTREGAVLQVRDDGSGFDYESARRYPRGLGLLIMDYCATKAGLRLNVTRNEGRGVAVWALAPGPCEEAEAEPNPDME